eukprot:3205991-Prorocentrum_lima.AAC.1
MERGPMQPHWMWRNVHMQQLRDQGGSFKSVEWEPSQTRRWSWFLRRQERLHVTPGVVPEP